jgi:DNA helicase-2/ATP-dependent DNA helicase PcrA
MQGEHVNESIRRYIGKCSKCKTSAAINYTVVNGEYFRPDGKRVAPHGLGRYWCSCGNLAQLKPMRGSFNPNKKCDARCMNAKGDQCDCACGGVNHGGKFNVIDFSEPIAQKPAKSVISDIPPWEKPAKEDGPVPTTMPAPIAQFPIPAPVAGPDGFLPSLYQARIFDWIEKGRGDAFVEAVAGSGKTTTLKQAAKRLKTSSSLFLAFNVHIKEELKQQLPPGMNVSTIHGIGMAAIRRRLGNGVKVEDTKYSKITREYIHMVFGDQLDFDDKKDLADDLKQLVLMSQVSLTDTDKPEEVQELMNHFGIHPLTSLADTCKALTAILNQGLQMAQEGLISYSDMLWLPFMWQLRVAQYDWVFVDEAQDLSPAQLELVLKCRRQGGRVLFVGDRRQAIYGFAGADSESVNKIIRRTGATVLPLSICYRCPSTHIAMARDIVPQIEARPNAPAGVIRRVKDEEVAASVQEGDLILCRVTAPLISTCFELIASGVPARVRGRDIGASMISTLKKVVKQRGFKMTDCVAFLDKYEDDQVRALCDGGKEEENAMLIEKIRDQIESLRAIYRRSRPATVEAFQAAIEEIFSDGRPSVMLSTVHRAKGLEERRVFLLAPEKMPHPMAKKPWEVEQEMNLKYVAFTRAKEELVFVDTTRDGK